MSCLNCGRIESHTDACYPFDNYEHNTSDDYQSDEYEDPDYDFSDYIEDIFER